jgi:hypothetical protein
VEVEGGLGYFVQPIGGLAPEGGGVARQDIFRQFACRSPACTGKRQKMGPDYDRRKLCQALLHLSKGALIALLLAGLTSLQQTIRKMLGFGGSGQ